MKTMNYFSVLHALTGCDATADVATMDRDTAKQMLRGLAHGRSMIAALEAQVISRLTEIDCEVMAEHSLASDSRLAPGQARAAVLRAEAIALMPSFGAALEDGEVTPEHVDAVARGLKKLGEKSGLLVACQDRLLAEASFLTVPRFAKFVENLAGSLDQQSENDRFDHQRRVTQLKMWEDHKTGMIKLAGQFDPERGSRLWTILDGAVERIFHSPIAVDAGVGVDPNDHRCALALCNLVEAGADESIVNGPDLTGAGPQVENFYDQPESIIDMGLGNVGGRVNTEIVVTIDLQTLVNGLHQGSVRRDTNGVDLPVDVIRRMACDAELIPMVLNGDGVVIDVGKAKRLATRRQRRAIFAMHETCAAPHCGVKVAHCVPHHIDWWEHGGGTDLHNLVPLCSRHHHKVHEGGWTLSMDASRKVTMTRSERNDE